MIGLGLCGALQAVISDEFSGLERMLQVYLFQGPSSGTLRRAHTTGAGASGWYGAVMSSRFQIAGSGIRFL